MSKSSNLFSKNRNSLINVIPFLTLMGCFDSFNSVDSDQSVEDRLAKVQLAIDDLNAMHSDLESRESRIREREIDLGIYEEIDEVLEGDEEGLSLDSMLNFFGTAVQDTEKNVESEILSNLKGIKTAEIAYESNFDVFVLASAYPVVPSVDSQTWVKSSSGGFATLGWSPDGLVRGSYSVSTTSTDFTVIGVADVTGNGDFVTYRATKSIDPIKVDLDREGISDVEDSNLEWVFGLFKNIFPSAPIEDELISKEEGEDIKLESENKQGGLFGLFGSDSEEKNVEEQIPDVVDLPDEITQEEIPIDLDQKEIEDDFEEDIADVPTDVEGGVATEEFSTEAAKDPIIYDSNKKPVSKSSSSTSATNSKDSDNKAKTSSTASQPPKSSSVDVYSGTAPKVNKSRKSFQTKQLSAKTKNQLKVKATKDLQRLGKQKGYSQVENVKLSNVVCIKRGCTGIGKGAGVKSETVYSVGNSVIVSSKRALIFSKSGSSYQVQFADGTKKMVSKSALKVP